MKKVLLFFLTLQLSLPSLAQLPATFSGTDLGTGKEVKVEFNKVSNGLVLVFLSSVCPCSNSHVPVLKTLAAKYKDFTFIGVHSNADEELPVAQTYFKYMALPFPVLQDDKDQLANAVKAVKTPHAFIISPEGKILYQGGVTNTADASRADKMYLENALEDLTHHREVQKPFTRTLGCMIARPGGSSVWE